MDPLEPVEEEPRSGRTTRRVVVRRRTPWVWFAAVALLTVVVAVLAVVIIVKMLPPLTEVAGVRVLGEWKSVRGGHRLEIFDSGSVLFARAGAASVTGRVEPFDEYRFLAELPGLNAAGDSVVVGVDPLNRCLILPLEPPDGGKPEPAYFIRPGEPLSDDLQAVLTAYEAALEAEEVKEPVFICKKCYDVGRFFDRGGVQVCEPCRLRSLPGFIMKEELEEEHPADQDMQKFNLYVDGGTKAEKEGDYRRAEDYYKRAYAIREDDAVWRRLRRVQELQGNKFRRRTDFDRLRVFERERSREELLAECRRFLEMWPESEYEERVWEMMGGRPEEPEAADGAGRKKPPARRRDMGLKPAQGRTTPEGPLAALKWLARHQDPSGAWMVRGYTNQCAGAGCTSNPGAGGFQVAVTALALLAFFDCGYGMESPDTYDDLLFGNCVRAGVTYLRHAQADDGLVGPRVEKHMYNHALATHALVRALESAGRTGSLDKDDMEWLSGAVRRAAGYLLLAQGERAGWRYEARSASSDVSVTVLALEALYEAERSQVHRVRKLVFHDACEWIAGVTDPRTMKVGYRRRGEGKVAYAGKNENYFHHEGMTAAGWFWRDRLEHTRMAGGHAVISMLMDDLPRSDTYGVDYFYWHYGTRLMQAAAGERDRDTWNETTRRALSRMQNADEGTCKHGSWEPWGRWCFEGGRVYATALNAMTLRQAIMVQGRMRVERRVPLPAVREPEPPREPQEYKWVFHFQSGGKVRVVSYQEEGEEYILVLKGGGRNVVTKSKIKKIEKYPGD